jgi:hypothetical protein
MYLVTRLYWAVDCPGSTYFLGTAGPEYLTSLKSGLSMGPYFFMKNIFGLDDFNRHALSGQ